MGYGWAFVERTDVDFLWKGGAQRGLVGSGWRGQNYNVLGSTVAGQARHAQRRQCISTNRRGVRATARCC